MRSLFLCAFVLVLGVAYSKSMADIAIGAFANIDADKNNVIVLEELEAYFHSRDADDDGRISKSDLLAILDGNQAEANFKFAKFDANKDGVLTVDDVGLIFNQFDEDGDGQILLQDYQAK